METLIRQLEDFANNTNDIILHLYTTLLSTAIKKGIVYDNNCKEP